MTAHKLRRALVKIYGQGSTNYLARHLADDMGVVTRSVTYWLEGERAVPPYMPLIIEALKARADKPPR